MCGVVASAAWSWTGSNLLRLFSGLLLVGPLLGGAWAANTQIGRFERLANEPPCHIAQTPIKALPYTLPGSASDHFASWLKAASAWWQEAKSQLGRPLMQLVVSSIFSLTVAAQLGLSSLGLTAAGLVAAYASRFSCRQRILSLIIPIGVPLCLAWLLGHAAYNALRPASVVVAASFAIAFCGCNAVQKRLKYFVTWQVIPQVIVAVNLVVIRQPVAAAAVALLGTSQVLLAPLLETRTGRDQYFRAIQIQLTASMLFTALALNYKP